MIQKKINLQVPINAMGYGVVGFNLWRQLTEICDVTLWPIGPVTPPRQTTTLEIELLKRDVAKQDNFNPRLSTLKVWHENRLAERIGRGEYFTLPFFEVNKFDSRRKSHLKSVDQLIVTSQWAKNIALRETEWVKGYRPAEDIHVVPCGVDRNIFNEKLNKNAFDSGPDKCVFFNCGKWEIRKGHDILHKAFKDAFSDNELVELWMMNENPFLNPQEKQDWESLYQDSRIKLIPRVQYQEDLAKIIARTRCGVFPARAEGWNLELLEMMSMGKRVIATDYSAHTQFCSPDNCLLLNIEEEEPMYDGKWFVGDNGTWASLEGKVYEQLVSHLRTVYADWLTMHNTFNYAGIETAKTLSWESMAQQIYSIIFGEEK